MLYVKMLNVYMQFDTAASEPKQTVTERISPATPPRWDPRAVNWFKNFESTLADLITAPVTGSV